MAGIKLRPHTAVSTEGLGSSLFLSIDGPKTKALAGLTSTWVQIINIGDIVLIASHAFWCGEESDRGNLEDSVESLDSLFTSGISGFSGGGTELDRAMATTASTGAVSV